VHTPHAASRRAHRSAASTKPSWSSVFGHIRRRHRGQRGRRRLSRPARSRYRCRAPRCRARPRHGDSCGPRRAR
jgi:hypothetical protein